MPFIELESLPGCNQSTQPSLSVSIYPISLVYTG